MHPKRHGDIVRQYYSIWGELGHWCTREPMLYQGAQVPPCGVVLANNVASPLAGKEAQNNHRHNECHLRMVSKHLHASIPTWAKHQVRLRITHPKQSDKQSPSQTSLPATTTDSRKCYICNDPNHLANACSLGIEHKQMLRKILLLTAIS